MRNVRARVVSAALSLCVFVAALGGDRWTPSARASGVEEPAKTPPTLPPESAAVRVPDCATALYARLSAETATLRAAHAGDDAGFAKAYAQKKAELVGPAAMAAAGCGGSTLVE